MSDIDIDREALALFEALMDVEPLQRERRLVERANGRSDLVLRVQRLLAADEQDVLHTGGAVRMAEETSPPDRLGGYRIGERIGAGGMGSVYRATRDRGDFEHLAAVKIVKPGLLSQRLIDRFRHERQILAQLRHPHIAQLFDGGETEDGSPYIIMELVEGLPLLAWASQSGPSRKERIEKLLQACAAVGFAHANLIVHRDITPSNVLVTSEGVVKLIDFGIARPAGAPPDAARASSSPSLQTLSLTPGYAAPERMTGAEPTTATDIYSLGMIARELFGAESRDKELAAIIAKATAQRPQERYQTVDQFAADLGAWRDGRTVAAYRRGGRYAFAKFVSRHRRAAFAAVAGMSLLLTAFGGALFAWFLAERAREAEAQRFEDVRTLANYLLFDLNEQLRAVPGNTAARADLAARAQAYLDTLSQTQGASRALRMETANGFLKLAEIQDSPLDRNLGQTGAAKHNLDQARLLAASVKSDFGDAPDIAVLEARIGAIAGMIAFYEESDASRALALLREGKAALERAPPNSRDVDWRLAQRDISRAEMERFSANEEFEALIEAADLHEAMVEAWPEAEQGAAALERAHALYNRGVAWSLTGREKEGYPAMRAAHDAFLAAERDDPNDPSLLYMIGWSGADAYAAAARLGRAVEAEDVLLSAMQAARKLVEIEDRDESAKVLNVMVGEAWSQHLGNTGRFDEAIAEQRRIVEAVRADMDETSSGADFAWSQMILGLIARQAGERELVCSSWREAEAHFSRADAAGRLIAFHQAFLPGLRANLELCGQGRPLSEFGPLRR